MNKDYIILEENGIKYISFPTFEKTKLAKCVFSTRQGGASPPPYNTLNLGLSTDDNIDDVIENRKRFSKIINKPITKPLFQIHGIDIVKFDNFDYTDDFTKDIRVEKFPYADGVITNLKGLGINVSLADCIAIFILDPINKAAGIAHSGWRGTVKNIAGVLLEKMKKEYNTKPENCLSAVSPGIAKCCFLVNEEVYEEFNNTYPEYSDLYTEKWNKYSIDLHNINKRLLLNEGIKESNISMADLCTSCNKDIFFSHRRDKGITGRMMGIIALT
ncbi:MAG: peptidoglycan editing factor PgeF [Armatimonadota bacterium]